MINTVSKDILNIALIFILSVLTQSTQFKFYLIMLLPGIIPGIIVKHL